MPGELLVRTPIHLQKRLELANFPHINMDQQAGQRCCCGQHTYLYLHIKYFEYFYTVNVSIDKDDYCTSSFIILMVYFVILGEDIL